jgi:Tfp pilus assembly protein PilF
MALGQLYLGKIEEAEELWEDALEINPKHYDTNVNLSLFKWKLA